MLETSIGRFTTPDPIGLASGINLYQYSPNPIGWVYPWGWSCSSSQNRRIRSMRGQGYQDHHIISDKHALTKNHPLLKLAGFDLQSRQNKVLTMTDELDTPLAWRLPTDYHQKLIGSYDEEQGSYSQKNSNFDYLSLLQGLPYPRAMDRPSIYFPAASKKIVNYDCLWLLGRVPFVSERLANFISSHCAQDVEFISPTAIFGGDKEVNSPFFILNALHNVDIMDLEKSDAERDEDGDIVFFKTKYFKQIGMGKIQIARELYSRELVISRTLADKIIEARFNTDKGLGFYHVQRRLTPYRNEA